MGATVTLELSDKVAQSAREIAYRTHRQLEDVIMEWIDHTAIELPAESLPNDQILIICDMQMDQEKQDKLSDFLARNREGLLSKVEQQNLEKLMDIYRQGLVRKAQAMKIAVERNLIPPLH